MILVSEWGKDHWSTLAYIETRIVDYAGVPDFRHMRCNKQRHPQFAHCPFPFEAKNGTRLYGYFYNQDGTKKTGADLSQSIPGHDEWDCVEDAIKAGFLIWKGTGVHPVFVLTELGLKVCAELRAHKAQGKHFASFRQRAKKEVARG